MGKYILAISTFISAIQPLPFAATLKNIAHVSSTPVAINMISASSTDLIISTSSTKINAPTLSTVTSTKVWVTAYSSSEDETDDTPFITAYMTDVREGIVATNLFPFGTKIQIPEIFGDKIFVVEDKMHRRKKNFIDIWMPSKEKAKKFGIRHMEIAIVK